LLDFLIHLRSREPALVSGLEDGGSFTEQDMAVIDQLVRDYLPRWIAEHEDYGTAV